MMSSRARDDRPYSVFVSYSRRDDVGGWVTELVAALRREFERSGDRDFRVFFDRSDIRARDEWEAKLRWALREAPVVVVCTSREYFASDPCLWEFLEHEGKVKSPQDRSRICSRVWFRSSWRMQSWRTRTRTTGDGLRLSTRCRESWI